jgi:uncharacterized protein
MILTARPVSPVPEDLQKYRFWEKLFAHPAVEQVWLFGSRARGTHRPKADIDLLISCPTADVFQWDAICQIIEEADTLLEIDCIRLETIPLVSELRDEIERDGVLIFNSVQHEARR